MAEKIVLSLNAEKDRLAIIKHYIEVTGDNKFSLSVFDRINDAFETISNFPYSGKQINKEDLRVFIINPYNIVYKITNEVIEILHIWDSRQDPEKLPYG